LDGLLFDTETLYQEAMLLAAAEGDHEIAPDVFNRTVGLPWAQSRALLLAHFGEAFPADEFQAAWVRHFWVIAEARLALKPGALELLDTLNRFRLPRAIATSSSRQTVERHMAAHGRMGRFDAIVGQGDYERGKPSQVEVVAGLAAPAADPVRSLAALKPFTAPSKAMDTKRSAVAPLSSRAAVRRRRA
jgi:beta-phosphoglucomutase-like phosphatase (HAD superfamily)